MNKFSFSEVFNFLNFGSEQDLWFLSHHLSGSDMEKKATYFRCSCGGSNQSSQFSGTEVAEFPQSQYNDQNKTKQAAAF